MHVCYDFLTVLPGLLVYNCVGKRETGKHGANSIFLDGTIYSEAA